MLSCITTDIVKDAIPLWLIQQDSLDTWLSEQPDRIHHWINANQFEAKPNTCCLLPNANGGIEQVLMGVSSYDDPWGLGDGPIQLPEGTYYLANTELTQAQHQRLSLSWILGHYRFTEYKKLPEKNVVLALNDSVDVARLAAYQQSYYCVRDLINSPVERLNPDTFGDYIDDLAKQLNAKTHHIIGDKLLKQNLNAIHTVGRASQHEPRLTELTWGDKQHPSLVLVGKGVCFDSGGLDIKIGKGMLLMKKDMGGAALALGLAILIIQHKLPVHLRVVLPIVENAISSNAYRPSDVINTHHGLSVEVTNTDAEGRLILADALSYAQQQSSDLVLDFATLTGAARVALGTEIPAFFTPQESLATQLIKSSCEVNETLWRLPLYPAYNDYLDSQIADLKNAVLEPYGGAITAGLFLQRFIEEQTPWIHVDFMGWNRRRLPGRPEGGEAQGLQAFFHFIQQYFA